MGIQIIAASLALIGVMAGSAVGGGALADTIKTVQQPPRIELAYTVDCTQDQLRIQDRLYTGDQAQDHDQLRIRDCVAGCNQEQFGTQDQSTIPVQDQLRTQEQLQTGN